MMRGRESQLCKLHSTSVFFVDLIIGETVGSLSSDRPFCKFSGVM